MTHPSWRADISGITAPALAISAVYAAASSVDPIFRALKEYPTLSADWERLCDAEEVEVGDVRQARSAMDSAADRVTATTPTTAAGAAALIRHVIEDLENHETTDTSEWPARLLFVVADALDGIADVDAASQRRPS